jgi:hypothetical protein
MSDAMHAPPVLRKPFRWAREHRYDLSFGVRLAHGPRQTHKEETHLLVVALSQGKHQVPVDVKSARIRAMRSVRDVTSADLRNTHRPHSLGLTPSHCMRSSGSSRSSALQA